MFLHIQWANLTVVTSYAIVRFAIYLKVSIKYYLDLLYVAVNLGDIN